MKMQNKSGGGCPGLQIEVIVEMPKKSGSGAGGGVRWVDVYQE